MKYYKDYLPYFVSILFISAVGCIFSAANYFNTPDVSAPVQNIQHVEPRTSIDLGNGRQIIVPEGSAAFIELDDASNVEAAVQDVDQAADGRGPEIVGAIDKFDISTPTAALQSITASAGRIQGSFFKQIKSSVGVLYVIGGLAIIGGLVWAFGLGAMTTGLAASASGLLLIVAASMLERAPWLMYLVFLAALGVAGFMVYDYITRKQDQRTLATYENARKLMSNELRAAYDALINQTAIAHKNPSLEKSRLRANKIAAKKPDPDTMQVIAANKLAKEV